MTELAKLVRVNVTPAMASASTTSATRAWRRCLSSSSLLLRLRGRGRAQNVR